MAGEAAVADGADGVGEVVEEGEVGSGDGALVVQVGLDQLAGPAVFQAGGDALEDDGKGRFEVTVLSGVGGQFPRGQSARFPASVEGMGQEPAGREDVVEESVELGAQHGRHCNRPVGGSP